MTGRGLLLRLLAVGLSLLMVVALFEVGLRLVPKRSDFVDTALDEKSHGILHSPDFRGRRRPVRKPPGRFRLLVLGDSFAWGAGVYAADAYPLRLERRLRAARPGLDIEVLNWSRSGWNTEQAWRSVEPRLRRIRPDLVVLGFTLNDSEPSHMQTRQRLMEPLHRREPANALSRALHRHSGFYRLFWERFENRRQRRAFVDFYHGLFTGESWQRCRQAMVDLREAAAELGAPVLLVVFPIFDSQLDDAYPYRRLHDQVTGAAAELEMAALDLLPGFAGVDAHRLAVTPFTDPHPNELAHRLAADMIAGHLLAEGLVPGNKPKSPAQ